MGLDRLTEKEKKCIKNMKPFYLLLYVSIAVCILMGIYLWYTKEHLVAYVNNHPKEAGVVTKTDIIKLVTINFQYFTIVLIVPIVYCIGWIKTTRKLSGIIHKLIDTESK